MLSSYLLAVLEIVTCYITASDEIKKPEWRSKYPWDNCTDATGHR
jgi:hypothetical protein